MQTMSRKKPIPQAAPEGDEPPKKRYPSRDAVKYVGLPLRMYRALERYAEEHSTEFDRKSITWAARVLFGPVLDATGLMEPLGEEDDAS